MEALIQGVRAQEPTARRGLVRSQRPAPYRRIDCDGRVLAYLRPRCHRGTRGVRIDLSGLWVRPCNSRLEISGRSGSASLLVRGPDDLIEAIAFLVAALRHTRRLLAMERPRAVC